MNKQYRRNGQTIKGVALIALFVALPSLHSVALAQASMSVKDRPKIGLVLGGGGARGAAHVGVLKVLEEKRIPIDAIVGTSVGAIIGGLYASGVSVENIEKSLLAIDWVDTFDDNPPRPDLSFRRKQDDLEFLIKFDLGHDGNRFLLPKGLVQGQKLNQIFLSWTQSVQNITDFNQLPIPFKAIATNIETGTAVVIDEGSLATAMRASMSIPAAFAPVEYKNTLLVDGGISNNVPIDIVRNMNVDIIIVVDVGFPLLTNAQLESALDISNQVTTIIVKQNAAQQKAKLQKNDILIEPSLGVFSSADFPNINQVIPHGKSAAMRHEYALNRLSMSESEYKSFNYQRQHFSKAPVAKIEFIALSNDANVSSALVKSRIKSKAGETLNVKQVNKDLSQIYGLGLFESVNANIVEHEGKQGLQYKTQRKSWGPHYVNFGLSLEDDLDGGSSFNIAARITSTELNSMAAEWRNDFQFGDNPAFTTEWYQPISNDVNYFLAPAAKYEEYGINVFNNERRVAEFRITSRIARFDIGRELGDWGEVRLGLERGNGDSNLRTGDLTGTVFTEQSFYVGAAYLKLKYDRLNNAGFPSDGSRMEIDIKRSSQSLQADDDFDLYRVSWLRANTQGRHTVLYRFAGGTISGENPNSVYNLFRLGGFLNLSGLNTDEKVGRHFGIANLVYYRRFGSMTDIFGVPVYIGASIEAGNVWENREDIHRINHLYSGSVFVGVDSFLGPVYLAAGATEEGRSAFHFSLGRSF